MSAQTGEQAPEAPASARFGDRVAFRFARLVEAPNPIWIRELKQSARLSRTPFILMSVTVVVALAIAAIGGSASDAEPSDVVGAVLFHTFFSVGYFVVALVGPALAANAIASEREGRTWEAVVLTGLTPKVIAKGKFLAAYSAVASYIVMLAPVGALPFLFGGVHWLEVVIGFVYLFLIAALAVAFGLAMSSKMPSSRGAIMVTLLLSVPLSGMIYGIVGPGLSFAIHELWPRVAPGLPFWLPTAYVRASFGLSYVLVLFVLPALVLGLPGWLLYEATVANLTEPTDDRSSGLKRWFVATTVLIVAGFALALLAIPRARAVCDVAAAEVAALLGFLGFVTLMFTGEPLGPTRRVTARWRRAHVGAVRRFFGPGLLPTVGLSVALGLAGFAVIAAVAVRRYDALSRASLLTPGDAHLDLLRFTAYAAGFFVFTAGLAVWLRSRSNNVAGARIVLVVVVLGVSIVPWIATAILGVASRADEILIVAAPSPFFAVLLLKHQPSSIELAGVVAACAWAALGLLLLASGRRRVAKLIDRYDEHFARAEAALAAEELAALQNDLADQG